jgi:hypothetical protein
VPAPKSPPDGALFHPDEIAKLPKAASQPYDNWDDLVKHGTEGLEQYKAKLGEIQKAMGLVAGKKPDALSDEEWGNDKGYLFIAPLKGQKRASDKVRTDYRTKEKPEGDWSKLRDLVRATISMPTMAGVKDAVARVKAAGLEVMQQPKDRFAKPTPEGYRDLMMIVKLPNGMCAELQVHVKAMTLAKEAGHGPYASQAELQRKYGEDEPTDKWSDDDHASFYEYRRQQQKLYGPAWEKASSDGAPEGGKDEGKLIKSEQTLILVLRKKENQSGLHRE